MSNWIAGSLIGGAAALTAAAVVVLWQAFKHLDLKIERLDGKIDQKFDELRNHFDKKFDLVIATVTETNRLVAGHDAQIKFLEKQTDRLSSAVFSPQRFSAPREQHDVEHASEPVAPAETPAPGEGPAASAGGPEPTPPTAAIAPA